MSITTNKQPNKRQEKSMEAALWESANKLRGAVEPAEYKHVVLSLIFLKYAGDRFEQHRNLIENDKVEAILILPRNPFYFTDISVTLWTLNNNKKAHVETKNDEELQGDLRDLLQQEEKSTAELKNLSDKLGYEL